jgi:polysaccharide export outer membrane protein
MKKWVSVGVVLFLSGCFLACTIQPVVPPSEAAQSPLPVRQQSAAVVPNEQGEYVGTYYIRAMDPLIIQLSGIPEPQTIDVAVDADGRISLPHLGSVTAAGMTRSDLSQTIARLYMEKNIYRSVFVNIAVTAKYYYVQGEVNSAGQYPLVAGTTLMQALATARDTTAYASHNIQITRQGQIYKYDLRKIEKNPALDVEIEAGDMIKVLASWF